MDFLKNVNHAPLDATLHPVFAQHTVPQVSAVFIFNM